MARLVGHAIVWDRWTRIANSREGVFLERVARGATVKSVKERGNKIRALFQHGQDSQVGMKPLGPIDDLREDETGLFYRVGIFDSVPKMILDGLSASPSLYGASFQFSSVREDFVQRPGRSAWNEDGIPERTIKELRLYEISAVTWPAYEDATAGLRESGGGSLPAAPSTRVEVAPQVGEGSEPLPLRRLRMEAKKSRHAADLVRALARGDAVSLTWTRNGVRGRSVRAGRLRSSGTPLYAMRARTDPKPTWRL